MGEALTHEAKDATEARTGLPLPSKVPTRQRQLVRLALALALVAVVAAAAGVLVVVHDRRAGQSQLLGQPLPLIRPTGIPADVSTNVANLMGLSPVPAKKAPGFQLVDQKGQAVSLAGLRGKVVVLEFMDPHCVDICPLVSIENIDAYHDLGPAARNVVFVAVNVNRFHNKVADMLSFSTGHDLVTIPNWHFLTGPASRLESVWNAYGIEVSAPSPQADVIHTSIVYFVDRQGIERYAAAPMADHTASGKAFLPADQLAAWGHGIALVAAHLAA